MIFQDLAKMAGMKMRSEFEVVDVDVEGQEICLRRSDGEIVIVDLREPYLAEAHNLQAGCKIMATVAPAPSRFTPFLVWIFEGEVQVGSLPGN